ncbi:MAG: hypothetical protein ACI8RD_014806, partial [Bacillariaceae sp.]
VFCSYWLGVVDGRIMRLFCVVVRCLLFGLFNVKCAIHYYFFPAKNESWY